MCASFIGGDAAAAVVPVQDTSFVEKVMDLIYSINTGDGLFGTSSVVADQQELLHAQALFEQEQRQLQQQQLLQQQQHQQRVTALRKPAPVVLEAVLADGSIVLLEDDEDDDEEIDEFDEQEAAEPAAKHSRHSSGGGSSSGLHDGVATDTSLRHTPGTSNVFASFKPMQKGNLPGFRYYGQESDADDPEATATTVRSTSTDCSEQSTAQHTTVTSGAIATGASDVSPSNSTHSAATAPVDAATAATATHPPFPTENVVSRIDASLFQCRKGPNYNKKKEKAPSAPAMMELMSADWVLTPRRVIDVGSKLNIPAEWSEGIDTHQPGVPPLFIVNGQVPHNWPSTLFQDPQDGPCYMLVLIFRMKQETCEMMRDLSSAPPAVQLFARFCSEAPECYAAEGKGNAELEGYNAAAAVHSHSHSNLGTSSAASAPSTPMNHHQQQQAGVSDHHGSNSASATPTPPPPAAAPAASSSNSGGGGGRMSLFGMGGGKQGQPNPWSGRAKLQMRCENFDELGLPSFISGYNGKPVLIKESGSLIRGSNYVELVVNVKKFGMLAVNTLPTVMCRTYNAVLNIGFCIESREEDEMPEAIFGALQICKGTSDPAHMTHWFTRSEQDSHTATAAVNGAAASGGAAGSGGTSGAASSGSKGKKH